MTRRNQQRKKRNVRFDPLKAAGYDNRPHKHGIGYRLLHNRWIVLGGMGIIAFFTVFGTCLSINQGTSSDNTLGFETATPEPTATRTPDPNASPTATPTPTPTPVVRRFPSAPPMAIDVEKSYVASIRTSKGTIRVQLAPKEAPEAVNSFVFLARNNYYDGLSFHRVSASFAQGGDGGTGAPGYGLPVVANGLKHEPGAFVLARSNSANQLSGQFYIARQALPNQEGRDTVIGRVVDGMGVIEQLTARDPDRNPNAPPGDQIISITIEEQPAS